MYEQIAPVSHVAILERYLKMLYLHVVSRQLYTPSDETFLYASNSESGSVTLRGAPPRSKLAASIFPCCISNCFLSLYELLTELRHYLVFNSTNTTHPFPTQIGFVSFENATPCWSILQTRRQCNRISEDERQGQVSDVF